MATPLQRDSQTPESTDPMTMSLEARLEEIVLNHAWLMEALRAVRDVAVPEAYVGAGVVRDTVWDELSGIVTLEPSGDIDVAYFERIEAQPDWRALLQERAPQFRWDVTNQATIHRWQSKALGRGVRAYSSTSAAVAAWPETATAVAVRLARNGRLELLAPCGLDDLFAGVLRRNPMTPDPGAFARRLRDHAWTKRWPLLRVEDA